MDASYHNEPGYAEFTRLFHAFKVPVHAYIQTITGDHHTAEELTQELFIKLWNRRDRYDEIDNKDQYIYRMAHNACMSWFSKVALDARLTKEVKSRLRLEDNNVENYMAHQEAKALLEKALDTLSPQRRRVFELSRREGLKLPEIAEAMGISFHTANHHLVAAIAHIRDYFMTHSQDKALIILIIALIK